MMAPFNFFSLFPKWCNKEKRVTPSLPDMSLNLTSERLLATISYFLVLKPHQLMKLPRN